MEKRCSTCICYIPITSAVGRCHCLGIIQAGQDVILDAVGVLNQLDKNDNIQSNLFVQGRFGCVCHTERKNKTL